MKILQPWWSKALLVAGVVLIAIQFGPFGVDGDGGFDGGVHDTESIG